MKNECDEILEAKIAEQGDRAKKLYRYVSDVARRVTEATAASRTIADLFTTMLEVQRQKIRDNCEKLIFLDPLNHGRKSLELLWRKVYYETVSTAKKLREDDNSYDTYIYTLIVGGIGNFHHFITRIQSEMNVVCKELDYASMHYDEESELNHTATEEEIQFGNLALHTCLIYLGDLSRYQSEIFHTYDPSIAARYYLQAAHIDLSSGMPYNQLGNLYLDKNFNLDSVCYYIHCLSCSSPFDGAMGNLTKIFEKNAQFCENQPRSFSQSEHIQNAVANFLSLIEIWYLNKNDTNIAPRCNVVAQELKIAMGFSMTPLPDINKNYEEYNQALEEESVNPSYLNENLVHKIVQICLFTIVKINEIDEQKAFACKAFTLALLSQLLQKLLKQLEGLGLKNPARNYKPRVNSIQESEPEKFEEINGKATPTELMTNGNCVNEHETKEKESTEVKKLENGDAKANAKKAVAKRRRRRRIASSESTDDSEEDTGSSEAESDDSGSYDEDLSDSSFQSEDELKSDGSLYEGSDIEETKKEENVNGTVTDEHIKKPTKHESKMNKNEHEKLHDNSKDIQLNENEIRRFLLGENILSSIKLLQDWILNEKDLILSCGDSGESLFQCVVDLLNIFTYYFNSKLNEVQDCHILQYAKKLVNKLKLEYKTIPLPEDINLRGTQICKYDKNAAEWQILERYKPTVYEENVIRILNFIEFGNQIAKLVPRIRYNRNIMVFYLKKIAHPKLTTKINHKRSREWHNSKKQHTEGKSGGLLRRLGRLWLASRVRELELGGAAAPAPALLALDAAALTDHLRRVKQLVRTTNFVLLVPTVVLQELDDLKREKSAARDAIRWLELQLKSGSRFVRAQRPGQSKPLPLLKCPRKAPPHVHSFIQILEYCNQLVADEQPAGGGGGDPDSSVHGKSPLLVLLVGDEPAECKEFSLAGAAAAAGIAVQHICEFYARWRRAAHRSGRKR